MNEKSGCYGCCQEGCGKEHEKGCGKCCSSNCHIREICITEREKDFLMLLSQIPFLPLARFKYKSAKNKLVELAPVYLSSCGDSQDDVEKSGLILKSLENRGLITLDYDKPLISGDYSVFTHSEIYKKFCKDARAKSELGKPEAANPTIEYGSIALTPLGIDVLESLDILG